MCELEEGGSGWTPFDILTRRSTGLRSGPSKQILQAGWEARMDDGRRATDDGRRPFGWHLKSIVLFYDKHLYGTLYQWFYYRIIISIPIFGVHFGAHLGRPIFVSARPTITIVFL